MGPCSYRYHLNPAHADDEKVHLGLLEWACCELTTVPSRPNHRLDLDGHDAFTSEYQDRL